MATNRFGNLFCITTWGESHGPAVGVVIDGCPAGLSLSEMDIVEELKWRSPGRNSVTSQRKEEDIPEILSGVYEGQTTGAPISIIIKNRDVKSEHYHQLKDKLRPGHANFTYLEKYGVFDHRGGGRASGRETVCRVAAGAVANKITAYFGISILAYLEAMGDVSLGIRHAMQTHVRESPVFCPDVETSEKMVALLEKTRNDGDSLGGIVAFQVEGLFSGLGDPVYEKLEANLAKAMLSLPASKAFEIGEGFRAAYQRGSEHNDRYVYDGQKIKTASNHSGGILGGISNGMPIIGRVAFKPTSSIFKSQQTLTVDGKEVTMTLPEGSRHDPCIAIRAVPVVKAMVALVLADALLMNRSSRL